MATEIISNNINENEEKNNGFENISGGMLAIGENVGDYTIKSKINADSGEAELYVCIKDNESYVLKYYYDCNPKYEILEKLKSYDNPDIVSLYEYGNYKDHFYTILEYAKGGALDDRNEDGSYKYLPVSEDTAIQITREVINAFKELHSAGIIHRDIKPGNLFYKNEDGSDILVGDFGISTLFDVSRFTKHLTQVSGKRTEGYAAPEVYSGVIGSECDYYSFGVTLWELLTAKEPFATADGKSMYPQQIMHDTIQGKMFENLMARSPELSGRMRTLIGGLMTIRHDKRWNYELVSKFLDGEDVPVFQDVYQLPSFTVGEKECTSFKEIAQELLNDTETGKKLIYGNQLTRYLGKIDSNMANEIADKIEEFSAKNEMDAGLIFVVYTLCPNLDFKITDKISVNSPDDIQGLLKSDPDVLYPFFENKDLGFYTYLEVIGLKDIADKIEVIVSNTEDKSLVAYKIMIALDNNEIAPFKDGKHNNIKLSNINQLYNLEESLKKEFIDRINKNDKLICAWSENVSGRSIVTWRENLNNDKFKERVSNYGEYNYFAGYLNKSYIPIYKKFEVSGEFGLKDSTGEIVMEAAWQNIKEDSIENRFIVQKNDLWGVVDEKGQEIIPLSYKELEVFDELNNVYKVVDKDYNYKCINAKNECLLNGDVNNYPVSGNNFNYVIVNNNYLYSYRNSNFSKVKRIDNYYPAKVQDGYVLWGCENGTVALYDKQGRKLSHSAKSYSIETEISDSDEMTYFIVKNKKNYGIVDGNGKEVLSCTFSIIDVLENVIYAKKDDNIGCYDINKKSFVIPMEYSHIIYSENTVTLEKDKNLVIYKNNHGNFKKFGDVKYDSNENSYKIFNSNENEIDDFKFSGFLNNLDEDFSETDTIDCISSKGFRYLNLSSLTFTTREELYDSDWEALTACYDADGLITLAKDFKANGNPLSLNLFASLLELNTRDDQDYLEVKKETFTLLRKNRTEGLTFGFDYYMAILGRVFSALKNYQYSFDYYELAVSLNNEKCWYCWEGFDAGYNAKNYKEALPLIDRALELEPTDKWLFNRKGNCLYSLGKYEEAISYYTMAIEQEERKCFYNNRGNAYNELSKNGAPNLKQKAEKDWNYAKTLSD